MTDKLNLLSNRDHEDRSWSWWTGYNYGESRIMFINTAATNEADFWAGLGNYATKRSLQIKHERLEALIKQSYDESAN